MSQVGQEGGAGSAMAMKAKMVGIFINQVGVPTFIIIVFVGLIASTWVGKVPSPIVTSSDFHDHVIRSDQRHDEMVRNSNAQIEVLKEMKTVLRGINCDLKQSDRERVVCYKEMNEPN